MLKCGADFVANTNNTPPHLLLVNKMFEIPAFSFVGLYIMFFSTFVHCPNIWLVVSRSIPRALQYKIFPIHEVAEISKVNYDHADSGQKEKDIK